MGGRNGHNGEGLPGSLAAFMVSHLQMPPPVDRLPETPVPLSEVEHLIDWTIHSRPPDVHPTRPPDTQTDPPGSPQGKTLKAMLDAGMTYDDAARIISLSAETSTRQVCDPAPPPTKDSMAANRREWDRKYRRERRAKEKAEREAARASDQTSTRHADTLDLGIYIEDKKETISKEESKKVRDSGIRAREADFDRLWLAYPKRLGSNPRKPAWDKFQIAIKNGATPEEIIKGAQGFANECRKANIVGTRFVKTLVVWLNQHCWKDYQNVPAHNPMDGII